MLFCTLTTRGQKTLEDCWKRQSQATAPIYHNNKFLFTSSHHNKQQYFFLCLSSACERENEILPVWEPSPLLLLISAGQKNYSCTAFYCVRFHRHDFSVSMSETASPCQIQPGVGRELEAHRQPCGIPHHVRTRPAPLPVPHTYREGEKYSQPRCNF